MLSGWLPSRWFSHQLRSWSPEICTCSLTSTGQKNYSSPYNYALDYMHKQTAKELTDISSASRHHEYNLYNSPIQLQLLVCWNVLMWPVSESPLPPPTPTLVLQCTMHYIGMGCNCTWRCDRCIIKPPCFILLISISRNVHRSNRTINTL